MPALFHIQPHTATTTGASAAACSRRAGNAAAKVGTGMDLALAGGNAL